MAEKEKEKEGGEKKESRREVMYDNPRSKQSREERGGESKREEKPETKKEEHEGGEGEHEGGEKPMHERHAEARGAAHKRHETERRDMHGNHREEMRKMHGRHEAELKKMAEEQEAEMGSAAQPQPGNEPPNAAAGAAPAAAPVAPAAAASGDRVVFVMKSMEMSDDEKLDTIQPIAMPSKPDYPYGLRITLCDAELEKLGVDESEAEVGGVIHGHFLGRITSVSRNENGDDKTCRIEVQIEDLAVESEDEENEDE